MLETTERKYGPGWFRKTVIESLPHNLPVSASHRQLKLRVPLDFMQLSRITAPVGGGGGAIFASDASATPGTTPPARLGRVGKKEGGWEEKRGRGLFIEEQVREQHRGGAPRENRRNRQRHTGVHAHARHQHIQRETQRQPQDEMRRLKRDLGVGGKQVQD